MNPKQVFLKHRHAHPQPTGIGMTEMMNAWATMVNWDAAAPGPPPERQLSANVEGLFTAIVEAQRLIYMASARQRQPNLLLVPGTAL